MSPLASPNGRVLVVEDDRDIADFLFQLLTDAGKWLSGWTDRRRNPTGSKAVSGRRCVRCVVERPPVPSGTFSRGKLGGDARRCPQRGTGFGIGTIAYREIGVPGAWKTSLGLET